MSHLDLLSLNRTLEGSPPGEAPTVVVKIGTSSIMRVRNNSAEAWSNPSTAAGEGLKQKNGELALSTLALVVDTLIALRRAGFWVVLVTSGAVGVGCRQLNVTERPTRLPEKQALAAVGMARLMLFYEELFAIANESTALVLVSRSDFGKRHQYVNIRNTLLELFRFGVIPVVNENDTVATEELRFGDNDRLSALIAGMVGAKWLFLMTDVDCLYTANPRTNPDAKPLHVVSDVHEVEDSLDTSGGTQWGTGGMVTKLIAAKLATAAGCSVVILHGRKPERMLDYVLERDECVGTLFRPAVRPIMSARKRWILFGLAAGGCITVDAGAKRAMLSKKSLFAAGITAVQGSFYQDGAVRVLDPSGDEFAQGLVNYDSKELEKIVGAQSEEIEARLGYPGAEEVLHRDNIVLLPSILQAAH